LGENRKKEAVEYADCLVEEVQALDGGLTFLEGYAHYWAGFAKQRASQRRHGTRQLEEIDCHATAAMKAFSRVGNARMKLNVQRDLMAATIW
jgi:hypothetical protein